MLHDFLIALTMLTNFTLVATSRVRKCIQVAAFQGVLLGLLPLTMGTGKLHHILLMSAAAVVVKGWFIPFLLKRALQKVEIYREVDPYIGYTASLLLCAVGTGLSLVLENGIYRFGLLLIEEMPLLVETGVLLDLFVAIFVMGIVINHIRAAFDSMDTRNLAELKD